MKAPTLWCHACQALTEHRSGICMSEVHSAKMYTAGEVRTLVRRAVDRTLADCKNATGMRKNIETYVNRNDIINTIMGVE